MKFLFYFYFYKDLKSKKVELSVFYFVLISYVSSFIVDFRNNQTDLVYKLN